MGLASIKIKRDTLKLLNQARANIINIDPDAKATYDYVLMLVLKDYLGCKK